VHGVLELHEELVERQDPSLEHFQRPSYDRLLHLLSDSGATGREMA
jgi:hypothetical protein